MNPSASKPELRNHFKAQLRSLEQPDSEPLARRVTEWIRNLPGCSLIATFAGLPHQEPNLILLHEYLPNHSLAYPKVDSESSMSFHLVSDPTTLVSGAFGIREPDLRIHPKVLAADIDLYLCPGLAFGKDGSRLGRGGGFYDRALALAREDSLKLGVCFHFQRSDALPVDSHDAFMTHVDDGSSITPLDVTL